MAEDSKGSDAWLGAAEGLGGVPCPDGFSFVPAGDKGQDEPVGAVAGLMDIRGL
jgi:hypothetical protein